MQRNVGGSLKRAVLVPLLIEDSYREGSNDAKDHAGDPRKGFRQEWELVAVIS